MSIVLMKVSLVVAGYAVSLAGGGVFVSSLCSFVGFPAAVDTGHKRAGMVIGVLERFIILTFVLIGRYEAIAFVFAAKSIARFEELKDRKFSEYYLVGTLSSVSFAMLCGEILKYILKRI
ncbi:MAG: hypothetical protein QME32_04130 [Endomicrobiia bacterium]|nr:hypothetical protein [Endomicrobiia bacterium]